MIETLRNKIKNYNTHVIQSSLKKLEKDRKRKTRKMIIQYFYEDRSPSLTKKWVTLD